MIYIDSSKEIHLNYFPISAFYSDSAEEIKAFWDEVLGEDLASFLLEDIDSKDDDRV